MRKHAWKKLLNCVLSLSRVPHDSCCGRMPLPQLPLALQGGHWQHYSRHSSKVTLAIAGRLQDWEGHLFFFFFPHECEYFSSLKMKGRILEKRNCIRKVTVMPKEAFALMLPTERERFATRKLRRSLECPLKSAFVTAVTVFLLPMWSETFFLLKTRQTQK